MLQGARAIDLIKNGRTPEVLAVIDALDQGAYTPDEEVGRPAISPCSMSCDRRRSVGLSVGEVWRVTCRDGDTTTQDRPDSRPHTALVRRHVRRAVPGASERDWRRRRRSTRTCRAAGSFHRKCAGSRIELRGQEIDAALGKCGTDLRLSRSASSVARFEDFDYATTPACRRSCTLSRLRLRAPRRAPAGRG